MFAVIKSGGKQYKVALGTVLKLEKLDTKKSNNVIFKEVLMIKNDKSYELGAPFLENAEVKGKVLENKRDKKIIVFKKRRRHNSRRKNGHRQSLSIVKIEEISINGNSFKNQDAKKKVAVKKKTNKVDVDKGGKKKTENKKATEIKNTEKKG
ncbi:50S ribosomal protein L21 [Alphaproteobacteria bacterium]|nr:50S ribosomal protein L21 [Alphaproteobacteria bacterium]